MGRPRQSLGTNRPRWKLVTFTPDDEGFDKATTFVRAEPEAGRPVVIDFKYLDPQANDTKLRHPRSRAQFTVKLAANWLTNTPITSMKKQS